MKSLKDEIQFPCGLSMKNRFMLAPLTNNQSSLAKGRCEK